VADDRLMDSFETVEQRGRHAQLLAAANRELVAFVGVMIGVDLRLVAVENEQVAVPAVRKTEGSLLAERLLDACEPRLRVFPGGEVAVELIGAEGMVHVSEVQRARAVRGHQPGDRGELKIAVVAVPYEPGGEIAREGELLGELLARDRERCTLLVDSIASHP